MAAHPARCRVADPGDGGAGRVAGGAPRGRAGIPGIRPAAADTELGHDAAGGTGARLRRAVACALPGVAPVCDGVGAALDRRRRARSARPALARCDALNGTTATGWGSACAAPAAAVRCRPIS